jgi:glycerophosphoryl diester phosphodiesterase
MSACGSETPTEETERTVSQEASLPAIKTSDLPGFFDCVRDSGGVLIASHRAGPAQGFPENAIETLQYGFDKGIRVFEIDIATSRDGVLFLMHDRSLGRTTTANGAVANADWSEIARARLVDNDGRTTSFHPPKLSEALLWAKAAGAILEIDKKETTGWRSVITNIRAAGAENNVLLITYNDQDAGLVQELAPEMMLTAGARGNRDLSKLSRLGVDPAKVVAWTGTERPDSLAWERLIREGVEPAFGTLGRRSERLDTQYWADDDPSEYRDMVRDGLVLLATDEPYRVAEALTEDNRALNACGG